MLLSVNWLREFVPYEGTLDALCDRLTMIGMEVEEVQYPFAGLNDVVVGHVVACDKHPQADTLSVCKVDMGEGEPVQIVCGAPNVAAGQKVAVAPVGAILPNGMKLKKVKLRGEVSMGMICAEDELGLGEDHSGIMVLDPEFRVGTPLIEALQLDDVVLDVGVTPNRSDCFSILGLAREVGIAFNLPVSLPSFDLKEEGASAESFVTIKIDDPELCPCYRARVIEDITVGKSPSWMRYRLIAMGQRPISNVVDITNYVMFELGQPLHAFDLNLIKGRKIRVAKANEGMKFTTLDSQERSLLDQDILIWDAEHPVALAGVMGGLNSEINDKSRGVLLESAIFKPVNIRRAARRLNLPSEASYRFERGVDQVGSLFAVNRAAELIARNCGGVVRPGVSQDEPRPWKQPKISFRPERARKILGLPLEESFCRQIVEGMECKVMSESGETWEITAPSHRLDLEREVDIIEELGRVYGLDRIPATLPKVSRELSEGKGGGDSPEFLFTRKLKRWAVGLGLRETMNYSFVGQKDLDLLGLPQDGRIPVMNPLTDEQNVLRPVLSAGLLQSLRHNLAQGNERLRLFEVAHVFEADPESETTAREPVRCGILLHGGRWEERWPWPQGASSEQDYQDIKGLVEHLMEHLRLPEPSFSLRKGHSFLSPCVEVSVNSEFVGIMGRLLPNVADAHHARKPVWLAELDVDALLRLTTDQEIEFKELPKFPPVRRDITLAADKSLPVGRVLEHIGNQNLKLLEHFVLIDVFVPEQEPEERRLTFRLSFRHAERTLTDKDVDKEMEKMAKALIQDLGVRM